LGHFLFWVVLLYWVTSFVLSLPLLNSLFWVIQLILLLHLFYSQSLICYSLSFFSLSPSYTYLFYIFYLQRPNAKFSGEGAPASDSETTNRVRCNVCSACLFGSAPKHDSHPLFCNSLNWITPSQILANIPGHSPFFGWLLLLGSSSLLGDNLLFYHTLGFTPSFGSSNSFCYSFCLVAHLWLIPCSFSSLRSLLLYILAYFVYFLLAKTERQVQRRVKSASVSETTSRVRCNVCSTPHGQRTKWKTKKNQPKIVATGNIVWLSLSYNAV